MTTPPSDPTPPGPELPAPPTPATPTASTWSASAGQPSPYGPPMPRQPHLAFEPPSRSMAGWALGLAIVPCCGGITTVVGIGLAIAVLVKSRDGVDHGKALAIGALVVGPLWVVLALIGIATGMVSDLTSDAQRDDSGRVTQRSDQSTLTLRNGDCFDDKRLSGLTAEDGDSKGSTEVTAVPCYHAHQFEVFNLLELEPAPYPGGDELGRRASEACAKGFRSFIGVPFRRSRLAMYSLYPDAAGWEDGRRTVRCVVGQNGELTTGTLRATRW